MISLREGENVNTSNRLGINIRSLRTAYRESQEQLGEAIHVAKNTVSSYETGRTEPDKETLTAIAKHYMISVEVLLHSDLKSIGKITVDKNAFGKNIEIILPLASSDRAMQNENFKRAYEAHTAFYGQLHLLSLDGFDNVDVLYDGYMAAAKDNDIKTEATANLIALWYLWLMLLKTPLTVIKNKPAALRQVVINDEKVKKVIENIDSSFEADAKAILSELNEDEIEEMMSEMLTTVKGSKEWSDLADYYLALRYVWNLVDNDLEWGFNHQTGVEMMWAFATVRNKYAAQFLKCSFDSLREASSQFVDDI